ncbi:Nicotinamide N-methyltransferase-like [Macleaya cordata]|uniref:Nicotinamide N-methyltransferase-like n=1 Tax=Macleaya cordata TaxID=56857 RepID=A0A200Q5D4_MACCD|nr:Nicotinamide N-methyltransferase-like [Macleaya cordata]
MGGIKEVEIAGQKLVIHELEDVSDPLTGKILTGSWVWDSSLLLSEWMTSHGRVEFDFEGKTVLELGAGMGIPGMIAALLGATRVVLTDIPSLLTWLRKNVEANSLGDRVEVRELVWGSEESWLSLVGSTELDNVDLVLMSDVFYDTSEMAALGKTLGWIVKCGCGESKTTTTRIWSATEIRPWTGECLDELTDQGFDVIEFPSPLSAPNCSSSTLSSASSVALDDNEPSFAIYHLVPR